jgi:hypothetical protein
MNTVITMCDSNYFQYGAKLLETRHIVDAEFICYMPDATEEQIVILTKHGIQHRHIDPIRFKTEMQLMKFELMVENLNKHDNSLITFVDFDTYFMKDWGTRLSVRDFDVGITVRCEFIDAEKYMWAYANGGVIFAKNSSRSKAVFTDAIYFIRTPEKAMMVLPEYDEIWKQLESESRPAHKRHFRTDLRWWVDQVYLSAIVKSWLNYHSIFREVYKVKLFDCQLFNNLYGTDYKQSYIIHQKHAPKELKDA